MIIIGVDESGTGAWAGPFTVCAVALHDVDQPALRALGVADSKALTDFKRRQLIDTIVDYALVGRCAFAEVADILHHGQKEAWRRAAYEVISSSVGSIWSSGSKWEGLVIVDGNKDLVLQDRLRRVGIQTEFRVKADVTVPAVSAASIVAKTMRNDRMIELHKIYPEYGWSINAGYGTADHQKAIDTHGKTIWHRPYKNLGSDVSLRTHRS